MAPVDITSKNGLMEPAEYFLSDSFLDMGESEIGRKGSIQVAQKVIRDYYILIVRFEEGLNVILVWHDCILLSRDHIIKSLLRLFLAYFFC